MPRLDQDMEAFKVPGSFSFSGQKIDNLGATEFTVGVIAVDKSGSVSAFKDLLEKCLSDSVKTLRSPKNPRVDNMMLRMTAFDSNLYEIHGFKPISNCNPDDYIGSIRPGGSTSLFDASLEALQSMYTYAEAMVKQDFDVNGVLYVITDGDDNMSTASINQVRLAMEDAVKGERLESLVSVLIGVNIQDLNIKSKLDFFHKTANFSQYINIDDISEKSLARLTNFMVSQSISQSQSLGTGGPSKSLSF